MACHAAYLIVVVLLLWLHITALLLNWLPVACGEVGGGGAHDSLSTRAVSC